MRRSGRDGDSSAASSTWTAAAPSSTRASAHNLLNPAETDFDRARRQQEVVAATLDKVTSVGTALKLPVRRAATS